MRTVLAVAAAMLLAGCGGMDEGDSVSPEIAAWCADYCREGAAGGCWSEEEGGPAACEANCRRVKPGESVRESCAPDNETTCSFFYLCIPLAPGTTQAEHWQYVCDSFCEVTADCRPDLPGRQQCVEHCLAVAPGLEYSPGQPLETLVDCVTCDHPLRQCDPLFSAD